MRKLITISREYGSGGRIIGKLVAEKLGVPFYDKEIIDMAVEQSGLSKEVVETAELRAKSSFSYSLASAMNFGEGISAEPVSVNEKLFITQFDIIRQIGETNEGVIIGRCADFILRDDPDVVSVFIHAPLAARVYRAVHVYEIDQDKAEDICLKSDKTRANFYNYYSDMKWGMCRTYDLSLDSASLGIEGCIEMILDYTEIFKKHRAQDGERVE